MGTLVALAGWPAAEPPENAWCARLGAELPVALAVESGPGPAVVTATSADARLHVVVAGALANRREVEETVDRSGAAALGTRNHAALVLRLYEGRGEQCVSALRGSFAVAVWDGRRGRLVLARDQLGAQTLYYAAGRSHCVAATRLGPLLRIPGLAGGPDVALVDVVVALGIVPAPATVYPGIRQVCPGELLVWEPGRLRAQRYWQLRFPEARDGRRTVAHESVRRVREQLDEAVRIRASGVVPGMLLSGGLGAGSVLAVAAAVDRRPAAAITVAGDDAELAQAAALARRMGVEHVPLRPDVDWTAAADRTLAVHGAPLGGMDEALLAAGIGELGAHGRLVLLGCGAEEALGGAPAERTWAACERYRALPGLARECVDILAGTGWPEWLARTVQSARSAPVDVFAGTDVALDADARRALYAPELQRMVDAGPTPGIIGALAGEAVSQGASDARDILYAVRLAIGIPRHAARLSSALETELAFPLADPRVVQTSAAVPARVRASMRQRAGLLAHAVAAELPRDVLRQAHRPLVPRHDAWLGGSLRALADDVLASERVARLGFFDADAVARLRTAHAAGVAGLGPVLWRLVLVSRWLDAPARAVAATYSSAPSATSAVIASSS